MGRNGLPIKKREASQERQSASDSLVSTKEFKLEKGRAKSPGHDPPQRPISHKWDSTETMKLIDEDKKDHKSATSTPKNDQIRPQAATATGECSTTSPDLQHDLPMTFKQVVKNHHSGWLIPVTINQLSTLALLDTGATCSMILPLYETLEATKPIKVKQDEALCLEVIGGGAAPTLGTSNVQIGIAGGQCDHEIVISANKENPDCILGSNF